MKSKTKKIMITSVSITVVLVTCYFLYIGYHVSNGYRDYSRFCSKYIPQLEEYKLAHEQYPKSLKELLKPRLSFRYDYQDCRYQPKTDGYIFFVPEGLIGIAFYNSETGIWKHD